MFKKEPERSIAKRVLIGWGVLSIPILLLIEKRGYLFGGFSAGVVLSLLRLEMMSLFFTRLLAQAKKVHSVKKSTLLYMSSQILAFALCTVSLIINQWCLFGVVAGLLLVPFSASMDLLWKQPKGKRNISDKKV